MQETEMPDCPSTTTSLQHGDAGDEMSEPNELSEPNEMNELSKPSEPSKQWSRAFWTFCEMTTFHGLRYIAEATSNVRRCVWVTIVLFSTVMFIWQCYNLGGYYLSRPVRMKLSMSRQEPVVFPAVTICNHNAFRLEAAAESDSYHWLDDMHNRVNVSTFNYTKWGVGNLSMRDVYLQNAHRKEDMIASCQWRGTPCGPEDFKLSVTDAGVCYTFNHRISENSIASATGVKNGLQLVLNVEQYEYMKGPHNAVGLKLLLHHQDDVLQVLDFGDNIPVGMHTVVALSFTKETNLPPPHGDCTSQQKLRYFDRYSQAACYRECITEFVIKTCGCRDYYMPPFNTDEPPVCDVSRYTSCLRPAVESFNNNPSAACVCPKACAIIHYKSSMSYATANHDNENGFAISDDFLNRTGKHLNESLDTRERLLPDRRRANMEEAERVLSGLPNVTPKDFSKTKLYSYFTRFNAERRVICNIPSMIMGFMKMQDVLQHDFISGWDKMNVYNCISDSFELYEIFRDSVDIADKDAWRTALLLRLKEKLIASKRALYNLNRVHNAYHNTAPLINYNVTPNGSYDAIYLTEELFKPSTEISETYIRLGGHLKKYIDNVDGLYHIYLADDHEIEINSKCINYSNEFLQASEEYDRDLRVYESLVIRQPLQNVKNAKKLIELNFIMHNSMSLNVESRWRNIDYMNEMAFNVWLAFNNTDTAGIIAAYLDNLKNKRYVSKLYMAGFVNSDKVTQLVGDYQAVQSRLHELTRNIWFAATQFTFLNCRCNIGAASVPLLKAFFAKLYAHYKVATDSEKVAIEDYFEFTNDSTMAAMLIRGEIKGDECDDYTVTPPVLLNNVSLRNLISFKNKLKTFLQKTRLNGQFFSHNFLELNIYMRDLRVQEYEQLEAYTFIDLLSDIGGSMGLLIGASIITLMEAVDAFAIAVASRRRKKKRRLRRSCSYSSIAVDKSVL